MAKETKQKKEQKRAKAQVKPAAKEEGISKTRIIIAVSVLIILVLLIVFYDRIIPTSKGNVAVINGEPLTQKEFDSLYAKVPEVYKMAGLTEAKFLNDTLIPHRLLLQEAKKMSIDASESEVESALSAMMEMNGLTKEDFESDLKSQNITYDEFKVMLKEQIVISKLLNATLSSITIGEEEIAQFYDSNKELFRESNTTFTPLADVKDKIKSYLANKRFIDDVRSKANIQVYLIERASGTASSGQDPAAGKKESFTMSNEEICEENGKPLVILFSTTTCPHCKWIKKTFDAVAKGYADSGKIAAYHWEMDTGDNTLTSAKESTIPEGLANLFWKYSQQGGVPTFIFGCKYYRIGNAYETSDNIDAEEKDFRAVIDSLISEAAASSGSDSAGTTGAGSG